MLLSDTFTIREIISISSSILLAIGLFIWNGRRSIFKALSMSSKIAAAVEKTGTPQVVGIKSGECLKHCDLVESIKSLEQVQDELRESINVINVSVAEIRTALNFLVNNPRGKSSGDTAKQDFYEIKTALNQIAKLPEKKSSGETTNHKFEEIKDQLDTLNKNMLIGPKKLIKTLCLIVDEFDTIISTLNQALKEKNCEVIVANEYKAAQDVLKNWEFDVVFLDYELDKGYTALDLVKLIDRHKTKIYVYVNGDATINIPSYVTLIFKPFNIRQMIKKLEAENIL